MAIHCRISLTYVYAAIGKKHNANVKFRLLSEIHIYCNTAVKKEGIFIIKREIHLKAKQNINSHQEHRTECVAFTLPGGNIRLPVQTNRLAV